MRSRMLLEVIAASLFAGLVSLGAAKVSPLAPAPEKEKSIPPGKHPATLVQLMRGTLFVRSNVVFASQGKSPAEVLPAKRTSAATDPLAGTYGNWEAVENNSLAIIETADLLTARSESAQTDGLCPPKTPTSRNSSRGFVMQGGNRIKRPNQRPRTRWPMRWRS